MPVNSAVVTLNLNICSNKIFKSYRSSRNECVAAMELIGTGGMKLWSRMELDLLRLILDSAGRLNCTVRVWSGFNRLEVRYIVVHCTVDEELEILFILIDLGFRA